MQESIRLEKVTDFQLLKDKVYEAIKKSIINLSLLPSEPLVEQRLAQELGVSKSPIREALMRLEREGLVYTIPFKGCLVAKVTQKDIIEVIQLREALETFCVKYACKTFSHAEIQRAKEIISEAEEALRQDDIKRCLSRNLQFHEFLISQSKNGRIVKAYANLQDHLNRYRNIAKQIVGRVAKSHREHILIMDALEKKDEALAEKKMGDHFRSILEDFLPSAQLGSFTHENPHLSRVPSLVPNEKFSFR
jgi:DNA-binding GntR family transcriptional regulator